MTVNDLCSLQTLFSKRILRVPDYQRGYAWELTQWQDLIEDLELLPDKRQHFTGTVVLCPTPGKDAKMDLEGNSHELHDIVDGQQRLTTLVLLLDAIRRELLAFASRQVLAAGIAKSYIVVDDLNGEPMAKLRLNRDCHDYFFNNVLEQRPGAGGPTILAHERLKDAKAYFAGYLTEQRDKRQTSYEEWLLDLFSRVTQQLVVMVYTVDTMAEVGVIFETMNNRGKPISELEKVKNYLLYISSRLDLAGPNDLADEINETWTHIFEHLAAARLVQADDEDRLLRAHWLMAYDPVPQQWQGSRSIKGRFSLRLYQRRHTEFLADLRAYIDSLRNACTAFCDAHYPTHSDAFGPFRGSAESHNDVVRASEKLTRLRAVASFLPLLIAVRLTQPDDAQSYLEIVQLCEKYAFRLYRWRNLRVNAGLAALYRLGNDLYAGTPCSEICSRLQSLLLGYCSQAQFQERFSRQDEDWYHWSGIKYFLYEYEEHLAATLKVPLRMMWDVVDKRDREDTVEHILPQTPTIGGYWHQRFDALQRQRFTNDIGNLTLTFYNPVLGNKPFPEKRGPSADKCYDNSIILMEKSLAGYSDWTPAAVEDRRQKIMNWALTRWAVQGPIARGDSATSDDLADATWSSLSREQKLARLGQLAEERGVGPDWERLLGAADRHGLYLRPYESCVVIVPGGMRKIGLFTIWPKEGTVELGFSAENWFKYYQIPATRAQQAVGMRKYAHMTGDRVRQFIEELDQLFAEIAEG